MQTIGVALENPFVLAWLFIVARLLNETPQWSSKPDFRAFVIVAFDKFDTGLLEDTLQVLEGLAATRWNVVELLQSQNGFRSKSYNIGSFRSGPA